MTPGRVTRRTFHWPVDVREILGMGNDRHLLTDEQVAERRRKYRLSVAQPGAVVEAAKNLCLEWGDPVMVRREGAAMLSTSGAPFAESRTFGWRNVDISARCRARRR